MKTTIKVLSASLLLLTSCENKDKQMQLPSRIDSLESRLYHVSDTLQQLRAESGVEETTYKTTTQESASAIHDDKVYEGVPGDKLISILDGAHGPGKRYVFAVIQYYIDDNKWPESWYADITELDNFSTDTQAMFVDECIKYIRRQPEIYAYNRNIRVSSKRIYMSYSYAKASEKLSQLRDGV